MLNNHKTKLPGENEDEKQKTKIFGHRASKAEQRRKLTSIPAEQ